MNYCSYLAVLILCSMEGIEPRTTTLGKRDLTTKPANSVVASRGQEVRLVCGTNLQYQVTWWFTPAGSDKSVEFFFSGVVRPTYASRFEVDTSKAGHYTVVIRHVTMDHSGRYTCYDNEGEGPDHASVELTVIDAEPGCTSNSSQLPLPDNTTLTTVECLLEVTGNQQRELTTDWTTDEDDPSVYVSKNETLSDNHFKVLISVIKHTSNCSALNTSITVRFWFKSSTCDSPTKECIVHSRSFPLGNRIPESCSGADDELSHKGKFPFAFVFATVGGILGCVLVLAIVIYRVVHFLFNGIRNKTGRDEEKDVEMKPMKYCETALDEDIR